MPGAIAACAAHVSYQLSLARPVALACDASAEGVLAAIGITYLAHAREGQLRLARAEGLQPRIGEQVMLAPSPTEPETVAFATRVLSGFARTVTTGCRRQRDGLCPASCDHRCVYRIALACASDSPTMPEVVHRYVRLGFAQGPRVRTLITDRRVADFDDLARHVLGECEHTRQFVRFSHMADGSYAASFSPSANTIPLMARHFAARMRQERFVIADPRHRVAAFHAEGAKRCELARLDGQLLKALVQMDDLADDEPYVRAMWQRFYRGTSLPGRDKSQRGYDLRTKWMPQRLWDGLYELGQDAPDAPVPARYDGDAADMPRIREAAPSSRREPPLRCSVVSGRD